MVFLHLELCVVFGFWVSHRRRTTIPGIDNAVMPNDLYLERGRSQCRQGGHMTEYPPGWSCELTVVRLQRYVVESLPRREMLAIGEPAV